MNQALKKSILEILDGPVNTAKDCNLLSETIFAATKRKVSSTTLRRFFGLLPSKSQISKYSLDTLAIFCGSADYSDFLSVHGPHSGKTVLSTPDDLIARIDTLTNYTLSSIAKKSLSKFQDTIPRESINQQLNIFLESNDSVFPLVAPGGFGKSIALAHWVKSLDKNLIDCLFCSASVFYQLITAQNGLSDSLNLALTSPNNLFTQYINPHKKLVLIIDSLDEISMLTQKYQDVLDYFFEVINRYASKIGVKIIFSIREVSWNNAVNLNPRNKKYQRALKVKNTLEAGSASLLPFSTSETQHIINTRLAELKQSFHFNAIPGQLKELVKVPINLHYLIELLKKNSSLEIVNFNNFNRKFLNEFVFSSKYAEQKEDILWKMIDLMERESEGYFVHKNELRKYFPIHLKRETEFYNAYKELISEGIIYEERIENKYGIFTTQISFRHTNFYYYISALNQINNAGDLTYSLIQQISNSGRNNEWIINVVAVLFEIAYETEDYDTLAKFCELPDEVLVSLPVRFSVGHSFRINNSIRNQLIQTFASYPKGQIYFFEQFVDSNFMFNNYEYRIQEYLKFKQTEESKLFANSILFLAGFLKMDKAVCENHQQELHQLKPNSDIHPYPIGRKVASDIIYHSFVKRQEQKDLYKYIHTFRSIAYEYNNYVNTGLIEFELPILVALVITKQYDLIVRLTEYVIKTFKINEPIERFSISLNINNQNLLPLLFAEYSKFKLNQEYNENLPKVIEDMINAYPAGFDDFQYKILLKHCLSDLLVNQNNHDKSAEYFNLALDLSKFAKYDFYTAYLLLNNPQKDLKMQKKGEMMFKKSGFEIDQIR